MYTNNPQMPKIRRDAVLFANKHGVRKAARHYGYSPGAIVAWRKKASIIGLHPIPTRSSKPRSHPRQISREIVDRIVELRFETNGRCAEVLHRMLENEGTVVSLNSVRRTLDRQGLVAKRSHLKRRHISVPRPPSTHPGALVQVDTIHIMKNEKERIYVFTLVDVHSRWVHAWASTRCNTRTALLFLHHAKRRAPFLFNMLQSDNGPEFSQNFTERVKVEHRHSRVRRPNDNAHLERFNRTLQEECLNNIPVDVTLINKALPRYLKYYNTERLHLGINLKTPLQIIQECSQAIG